MSGLMTLHETQRALTNFFSAENEKNLKSRLNTKQIETLGFGQKKKGKQNVSKF